MAVDKLVDSTQLDADLTSVANAIRAKSGGSSQLAFPAGFVSEIGAIPSGGGGASFDWADLTEVTVGANGVTNTSGVQSYFAGTAETFYILKTALTTSNQFVYGYFSNASTMGASTRYRGGSIVSVVVGSAYDCVLVEGSVYYKITKK